MGPVQAAVTGDVIINVGPVSAGPPITDPVGPDQRRNERKRARRARKGK